MSLKVHVSKPLSSRLIIELLDENPDLEQIVCPQSLYDRTSVTYLDALDELGIKIKAIKERGRPRKYDDNLKVEINNLINQGLNPKAVAKKLDISLKTVYYLKTKKLKQGPKSKYSSHIKEEIIELENKGIPVKKIASKLNIPIRTIYYILQKEKNKGVKN